MFSVKIQMIYNAFVKDKLDLFGQISSTGPQCYCQDEHGTETVTWHTSENIRNLRFNVRRHIIAKGYTNRQLVINLNQFKTNIMCSAVIFLTFKQFKTDLMYSAVLFSPNLVRITHMNQM